MTETVLELIARQAADTSAGRLEPDVEHAAKRCLIDWFCLAIGGLAEEPVRMLVEVAGNGGGSGRILGLPGVAVSPYHAALVMGTASHVLDYDDTDHVNLIHVSSTIFPALFALAREQRLSGRALLGSFVAGYEAEDRIGHYLGRRLTAMGWHVSGVIGHLGSAVSAGLALGLSQAQLAHAAAIAGTAASGLIAAFGTMSKPLQLGRAAADGLTAAQLARRGFTGPVGFLEADPGLTRPTVHEAISDWSHVREAWGMPYAVLRNSFKPHASCMITHPAIDAAAALRDRLVAAGADWRAVERIECRVNPLVPNVAGYRRPQSGLEGKFSIFFCAVIGLLEGRATPDCFTPEAVARADVAHLLDRIEIATDPAMGEQQAEIRLRVAGRDDLVQVIDMAKGNPLNPMSDDELTAKFVALTRPRLGLRAPAVAEEIWGCESIEDLAAWVDRLELVKG